MLSFSLNKSSDAPAVVMSKINISGLSDLGRSWLGELYINCAEGKLRTGSGGKVHVNAYAYGCDQNTQAYSAKTEVSLLNDTELELGFKGVSEKYMSYVDGSIEELVENAELVHNANQIKDMHEYLLVEAGVNLFVLLKLVKTHMQAKHIAKLRSLMEEYKMEEIIKSVLSSDKGFSILESVIC